jgi:DNA mismatch repair protein MutS
MLLTVPHTEPGSASVGLFTSILFDGPGPGSEACERDAPACFADLNLDQVVDAITAGREPYNLKPFFYTPLSSADTIRYRHEVLRDLDGTAVREHVRSFAQKMQEMRESLAQAAALRYRYQKEALFLEAVGIYCEAVTCLARDLALAGLRSVGFLALREYLSAYTGSAEFESLVAATNKLKDDLSGIRYCLHIKGNRIRVSRYESEPDYSREVEDTFRKFQQGTVKDYRVKFRTLLDMDHVEGGILDLVARLHPEIFSDLDSFCQDNADYVNDVISRFDREVQFYIAYLEYLGPLRSAGLAFCYPEVSATSKDVSADATFDLALAGKLIAEGAPVVCNEFHLSGRERVLVVSGPNQGGKTTLARSFGQLHYLASIGCLVPGREAALFLSDRLFTHFEKEEDLSNLTGKLQDDLIRIREVLDHATTNSIIIMNEIFTSTTLKDALYLSQRIMTRIVKLDALCVCVTFLDEMASFGDTVVSMVSTVLPDNPAIRTYKVVRRPADGLAYAAAIAEKYGLTYERVRERLTP